MKGEVTAESMPGRRDAHAGAERAAEAANNYRGYGSPVLSGGQAQGRAIDEVMREKSKKIKRPKVTTDGGLQSVESAQLQSELKNEIGIHPVQDHLVIDMFGAETVSRGGIIIPETAQKRGQMGRIVAAGPGRTTEWGAVLPMLVGVGDLVLYSIHAGTEIEYKDHLYLIVPARDIYGKVDPL